MLLFGADSNLKTLVNSGATFKQANANLGALGGDIKFNPWPAAGSLGLITAAGVLCTEKAYLS